MVVSIPVKAIADVPATALAGTPVLDTGNYYPQRDGQIEVLDNGALTSSGLLQRHLPGAHVVKVFNNIYFRHLASLARPSGAADRSALPIAGDDAAAKAAVTAYLDSIGFDAVDDGSLADSWRQEPGTPSLRRPLRPVLQRDRQARRRRDDPRRPGSGVEVSQRGLKDGFQAVA